MIDTLYDFIRNNFIGESTTIAGADNLALLLTWACIIIFFMLFMRLGFWAFHLFGNVFTRRRRRG